MAVGSVMAGISVGIGIHYPGSCYVPSGTAVHESLLTGIASTIYYYVVGLVFCVLGYLALNLINRKYDLNKEISGGNPAAGIIGCRNVYWAVHHYKRSDYVMKEGTFSYRRLMFTTFIISGCSIIYELLISSVSSYLLGTT